jgi:hypothetical protein
LRFLKAARLLPFKEKLARFRLCISAFVWYPSASFRI